MRREREQAKPVFFFSISARPYADPSKARSEGTVCLSVLRHIGKADKRHKRKTGEGIEAKFMYWTLARIAHIL
jgi:hypothetical protein